MFKLKIIINIKKNMRSIIENIKEIEEENLKEVISLTNENDELKKMEKENDER